MKINIEIIPAIDIIAGECVRLSQGDYSKKSTYYKDPLEVALRYEGIGVKRLHVVDLDGAKASNPMNLKVLERIATATKLDIQYGGGIKSDQAIRSVFNAGASRAICGSIAITDSERFNDWLVKYGSAHIILGADIKDGFVATHGWEKSSEVSIDQIIDQFSENGLSQVICTDISKDGMLQGPSFDLYQRLQSKYDKIDITVSGGISSIDDIERLEQMNLRSVIVGKAIYEGCITMDMIKSLLC